MFNKRALLLLTICLAAIAAAPAYAVDEYGLIYPQEIAPALTDPDHASAESLALLQSITLPASLGITIPHIDTGKIHDTLPLSGPMGLTEKGYTLEQIQQMDMGDYNNIINHGPIRPEGIKFYASINEELTEDMLRQMTYGEYLEYYSQKIEANSLPTPEEQAQFAARNITLPDAARLLKDFHQYEVVLAQDDALLKEYLEGYYQFKVDWVLSRTQLPAKVTVATDAARQATAVYPVFTSDGQQIAEAKAIDGVTCLPMRTLFEACGTTVNWNSGAKFIDAHTAARDRWLEISLAEKTAELRVKLPEPDEDGYKQYETKPLDLDFNYCFVENGSTYLPLRTIAEALAVEVQWDAANKRVILQLPDKQ